MSTDHPEPVSDGGALVRLGLKVALGARGEYIAEYLDERRAKRMSARLARLGDLVTEEGVSLDDLLDRVQADDEAAEFVEKVIDVAARARYEPKLRYLARCLANGITTSDDAIPDMAWAKIEAVRDLEAVHVRLLHDLRSAQDRRATALSRQQLIPSDRPLPSVAEFVLIEDKRRGGHGGLPASTFHVVMAVLLRSGLVASKHDVEVEVEIDLDVKAESADASPNTSTTIMYRTTELGIEVLSELREARSGG